MEGGKKFGLIMPKKSGLPKPKATSVFESDSDDDDAPKGKRPVIPQKKLSLKSRIKQEELDPSIYEYDNIYDDMKAKQAESVAPKAKQSSRYIDTLMKAAEKRKKDYERRVEKKIQGEREKEGDKFKDKEEFVTAAYKKKMVEREEEEERERREAMLNDMMDVTKQKDLSGFYRHFLKQTVGEEKVPEFGARQIKEEPASDEDRPESGPAGKDTESSSKDVGRKRKKSSDSTARQGSGADVGHSEDVRSLIKDVASSQKKFSESEARQGSGANVGHSEDDAQSLSKDVDSSRKKSSESGARQLPSVNAGHSSKDMKSSRNDAEISHKKSSVSGMSDDCVEKVMMDDDADRDSDNVEIDRDSDNAEIARDSDNIEIDSDSNGYKGCKNKTEGIEKSYSSLGKEGKSKTDELKSSRKKKFRKHSDDDSSDDESRSSNNKRMKSSVKDHSGTDGESSQSFKEHASKKVNTERHKIRKADILESGSDTEMRNNKKEEARSKETKQPKQKSTRHDSDSSEDESGRDNENDKENLNIGAEPETDKRKNIYAKRTVGDVFIQAQARFFQRMGARSS